MLVSASMSQLRNCLITMCDPFLNTLADLINHTVKQYFSMVHAV